MDSVRKGHQRATAGRWPLEDVLWVLLFVLLVDLGAQPLCTAELQLRVSSQLPTGGRLHGQLRPAVQKGWFPHLQAVRPSRYCALSGEVM